MYKNDKSEMGDNLEKRTPHDVSRININEDWQLEYWSNKFRVSKQELREIVKKVGTTVFAVRQYIGK